MSLPQSNSTYAIASPMALEVRTRRTPGISGFGGWFAKSGRSFTRQTNRSQFETANFVKGVG